MNQTTKILSIVLIILLTIAFLFKRNNSTNNHTSNIPTSDTKFAFKDTTAINQIIITDNQKNKITLSRRDNDHWLVNQRYPVRPSAIHQLLQTVATVTTQSGVSQAALPNVQKMFEQPLKTIELYTTPNQKPVHKYHLGGLTNDRLGTYALLEGAKYPYVIQVLGHDGHLLSRYSTLEPDWRDLVIFQYKPSDIKAISLNYDNFFPNYSSTIDNNNPQSPAIQPTHPELQKNTTTSTDKIKQYIELYQLKYAEAYANEHPRIDSIQKAKPFCTITVTNQQNQIQAVPIYYMPITQRSKTQFDRKGNPIPFDQDRFFAFVHQNNDMMIVQQYNFGNLFQRYSDFTTKP
mgnify:FL=1